LKSVIKVVLAAILATTALFTVTQLLFFFPFYMTVVTETFNLANVAANDNYVKQSYYTDCLEGIQARPIFKKNPSSVVIVVKNVDGKDAIGEDNEFDYVYHDGINLPDGGSKPYRQRGNPVTVTINAVYPLEMSLWGRPIKHNVPVSFQMTAIGLRYYKDLDMELGFAP
jgi:hypothetical protein